LGGAHQGGPWGEVYSPKKKRSRELGNWKLSEEGMSRWGARGTEDEKKRKKALRAPKGGRGVAMTQGEPQEKNLKLHLRNPGKGKD